MHRVYRVTSVAVCGEHALHVSFDDSTEQEVDLSGILEGDLFSALRDPRFFAEVKIDPETHTIVWPNGADLDPETLHDWPKYREAMREMARGWAGAKTDA